jgi:hypothetical protein
MNDTDTEKTLLEKFRQLSRTGQAMFFANACFALDAETSAKKQYGLQPESSPATSGKREGGAA